MYNPHQLSYIIRQGDNLYQLAKQYHTTVPKLLSCNPDIDPYNLQVGTSIMICPGEGFSAQPLPVCPDLSRQVNLIKNMRLAWEQHVYWTRMLLISIAERLNDLNAVTDRLLQNPNDIANIFANYYSKDVAKKIGQLLTEHLKIGAALITVLRDGNSAEANNLTRQWYKNADEMANAFSAVNPYYDRGEMRKMLYSHLELTTQEVSMRLAKNYPMDIEAFNKVENEILSMADYFSAGLMRQFPQMFG